MADLSLAEHQALELRYDGPIPAQHLETDRAKRRRRRGTLAVLESQAALFLDAAERCLNEMEDLSADLSERTLAHWQREIAERRLEANRERCDGHARAAAEALRLAIPLRTELDLPTHPLVTLMTLLIKLPPAEAKNV